MIFEKEFSVTVHPIERLFGVGIVCKITVIKYIIARECIIIVWIQDTITAVQIAIAVTIKILTKF